MPETNLKQYRVKVEFDVQSEQIAAVVKRLVELTVQEEIPQYVEQRGIKVTVIPVKLDP